MNVTKATTKALRSELVRISVARGATEAKFKDQARLVQLELDQREAAGRLRAAAEGLSDEQIASVLKGLKP